MGTGRVPGSARGRCACEANSAFISSRASASIASLMQPRSISSSAREQVGLTRSPASVASTSVTCGSVKRTRIGPARAASPSAVWQSLPRQALRRWSVTDAGEQAVRTPARSRRFWSQPLKLCLGVPGHRRWSKVCTAPGGSAVDPLLAPAAVGVAQIVITDAELESTRPADLVRATAGSRSRRFRELGVPADGTGTSRRQQRPPPTRPAGPRAPPPAPSRRAAAPARRRAPPSRGPPPPTPATRSAPQRGPGPRPTSPPPAARPPRPAHRRRAAAPRNVTPTTRQQAPTLQPAMTAAPTPTASPKHPHHPPQDTVLGRPDRTLGPGTARTGRMPPLRRRRGCRHGDAPCSVEPGVALGAADPLGAVGGLAPRPVPRVGECRAGVLVGGAGGATGHR